MARPRKVVTPTIKHEDDHVLNAIDIPECKAVGVIQVPGTNDYMSAVFTIKGHEVIKLDVNEPNLKAIANEMAKIDFVKTFMRET